MNMQKIIRWLTIATFIVPLIVVPSQFIFPFIVPKILVFRTLVLCMLGVFVIAAAREREVYRIKWSAITIALGLFLLSFFLSTFFGTDWYHSFWDNHERMLGLFTIIHYVLYYGMVSTAIRGMDEWKMLLRYFVGAASMVMIIGIMQKINPQFLLNNGNERVSATLGNAIYLGGYGLFTCFMSLLLFLSEQKNNWRWYEVATGILGFVGMIISGTRGSFVGFLIGLFVALGIYVVTLPKEAKQWRVRFLSIVAGFLVIVGILFAFRTQPAVQNLPIVGSLLNTTLGGTVGTRLMAWQIAIEAWRTYPIVGWGPNNFFYAFDLYYKPEFLEHGWGETWFDNAHNIIMNTLAVQGTLGLLTYLGLFVVVVWALVTMWRQQKLPRHVVSVGIGFLVAHLVQNIFVFENPTSYLFFMFFLAMINSLVVYGQAPSIPAKTSQTNVSTAWRWAIGGVIVLLIFVTDINPARANNNTLAALRALYTNTNPIDAYNQVQSIATPHIDDIRNDFARTVTEVLPQYVSAGNREEAMSLILLAISELEKNRKLHPYDLRVHISEAQLDQLNYQYFRSVDSMFDAEKVLDDALTKSPERQQIHYMLSSVKLAVGKPDEAIKIMRHSVDIDPKIAEGWWRLVYVLKMGNHLDEAKKVAQEATQKGIIFDGTGQSIINDVLGVTTSVKK